MITNSVNILASSSNNCFYFIKNNFWTIHKHLKDIDINISISFLKYYENINLLLKLTDIMLNKYKRASKLHVLNFLGWKEYTLNS